MPLTTHTRNKGIAYVPFVVTAATPRSRDGQHVVLQDPYSVYNPATQSLLIVVVSKDTLPQAGLGS